MKNKKGFTLVELLAVIAILAILMLMVTPNILKLFVSGQEDAFSSVVQTVWKAAEQDFFNNSVAGQKPGPYCYEAVEGKAQTLTLSGKNKKLKYYVKMDAEGDISEVKVATDAFYYDSTDTANFDFAIDSIEGKKGTADIDCSTGTMTPHPAE